MAGETGSARQEAERLVATVLAMTSQASDDTVAATADRIVSGLGQMGSTVAGFVTRATEAASGGSAAASDGPEASKTAPEAEPDEPRTGPHTAPKPGPQTAAEGDPWARATASPPSATENAAGKDSEAEQDRAAEPETTVEGDPWARATAPPSPADEGDPWAWATGAVRRVMGQGGDDRPGTHVSYGWSTGSVECCVCPVCRTIASMRNPTPQSAERLATGAGDIATGVATLMRAFSAMSGTRPKPARRRTTPPPPPDPDLAWSAATRRGSAPVEVADAPDDQSPWTAATRAANSEANKAAAERAALARAERERAAKAKADERLARAEAAAQAKAEAAKADVEGATGTGTTAAGGKSEARPWGWGGGDLAGDVWARATADPGVGGATGGPTVDHDETGDAARD